jgi:hypothetical protein
VQREIAAYYEQLGFGSTFSIEDQRPVAERVHRLTAMMLALDRWGQDRRFAAFLVERHEQHARLKDRYERVVEMAKGYYQLPEYSAGFAADEPLHEVTMKFRDGFRKEVDSLLLEVSDLISHTLLRCCMRTIPRVNELRSMGLEPDDDEYYGISADQTVMLLGALVMVILLYTVLVSGVRDVIALSRVAMIPIIYTVAVVCAVMPKQNWAFFRRPRGASPPALGYAISGLVAMVLAFAVAIAFRTLLESKGLPLGEALAVALVDFQTRSVPWLLMSFMTCVGVAAIIDSNWLAALPCGRRRWAESAVMMIVVCTTVIVVWQLLHIVRPPREIPPLGRLLVLSAVIGAIIGFMVPHWYRHIPRREPKADDPDQQGGGITGRPQLG